MATKPRFPDALMVSESKKIGTRMVDRVAAIADYAEPLLGVNRAKGERAYIRLQGNGKLFVTKSIYDTILFPKDHPRTTQPRYRWQLQPDGTEFGYLRRWKKKQCSTKSLSENQDSATATE